MISFGQTEPSSLCPSKRYQRQTPTPTIEGGASNLGKRLLPICGVTSRPPDSGRSKSDCPSYRLQHGKLGSIYAYTSELDSWRDKQALGGATDAPTAEADHQPTRIWRARRGLLVGGVVLVGLLAGAYVTTRSRAVNATQPKIRSLAVLPLKNLSGDPSQEIPRRRYD